MSQRIVGQNATQDSGDHRCLYTTTAGLLCSPQPPAPAQIQLPSNGASELLAGRTDVAQLHIRHTATMAFDQHSYDDGYDIVLDTGPSVAKLTRAGGKSPSAFKFVVATPTLQHGHGQLPAAAQALRLLVF
ncbi:hypothetical protein H4582DRAFT_2080762 [Lactarius indigo]|nr:hypothetical protein H4582DRAFT_2080762 [Lactarius indigo]